MLAVYILGDNIYDGMDTRFQVVNMLHGSRQWIPYFHELAENNVPLTLIEYWLLAGFKWLHVNGWIGLNITLFIWLDLTFAMLWQLLKRHLGLAIATVSLLIAAVYFPFYGYALFFYTDGLAVLFPQFIRHKRKASFGSLPFPNIHTWNQTQEGKQSNVRRLEFHQNF